MNEMEEMGYGIGFRHGDGFCGGDGLCGKGEDVYGLSFRGGDFGEEEVWGTEFYDAMTWRGGVWYHRSRDL